jgi:uncharacterized damage-inducible protein DinB
MFPDSLKGGTVILYGPKQLADGIRTVRKNTVLIAEDFHEDDYIFRPTPESRSVSEILTHILFFSHFDRALHEKTYVTTLGDFDLGKLVNEIESQEKKRHSKSELVNLLRDSGEGWARWVENLPEEVLAERVAQPGGTPKMLFEMILGTKEHEMHHRAQLTVIERMLGIVPHLTRRRQARSEAEVSSKPAQARG